MERREGKTKKTSKDSDTFDRIPGKRGRSSNNDFILNFNEKYIREVVGGGGCTGLTPGQPLKKKPREKNHRKEKRDDKHRKKIVINGEKVAYISINTLGRDNMHSIRGH